MKNMWTFLKTLLGHSGAKRSAIIAAWGKEKSDTRNLAYSKLLFEYDEPATFMDEQSADDLDLDGLFRFVDRTVSAPGAQVLYHMLRQGGTEAAAREQLDKNIRHLAGKDHEQLVLYLHDLSGNKDYLFPYMLFGELPEPTRYLFLIRPLQLISFACLLFGLIYPVLYICFVPILAVNLFIHYRHKQDVGQYVAVFSRLKQLHQTGTRMLKVMDHVGTKKQTQIKGDLAQVAKMLKRTKFLETERMRNGEVAGAGWAIAEVFKFATLLDVTIFTGLLLQIERYRASLVRIYRLVAEVDVALSVIALRRELPYYCEPDLQEESMLRVKGVYHPLVPGAVANDLELTRGNLLITGSNMSGKSTFIKTLNLNAITAQVLNTAFAEQYTSRTWRIATSINLKDDLDNGSSYYLSEVQRIGELMEYASAAGLHYMLTIDEVFKGTNTIERIAAAKAILAYLAQKNAIVLVSTHDLELADLLKNTYELYHFQESVGANDLSFDYKIKPGVMTQRNAVKLLRICGYPMEVVSEAERIAEAYSKPD